MRKIKICEMTTSHCDSVFDLQVRNKMDFGVNIWKSSELKELLKKDQNFGRVFVFEKKIQGFCLFSASSEFLEIYTIFVDPFFRNNGVARYFLREGIKYCKKNVLKKIILEVNEINKLAIKLYKKNDFVLIGKRKNYYNINGKLFDAILMQLMI